MREIIRKIIKINNIKQIMKTNKQNNKNLGKKDPLMKIFPGGLVIVNPPRHYPTPPIYMNMIRSKMRFDDLENGKMKMDGQIILRDLQKRPMDITEFVDKFDHYNRLSWAYANLLAEENACQNCRFEPIYTSSELPRYKVRVDRKFIESPDMMESAKLEIRQQMFYDTFGYEEARRREKDSFITQAKVYYIDPDFSDPTLLVEFTSDDLPYEDQEYDIIIMPNAMVYHSRCRTLEWIHNQCGYGEFLFPEMRDSLITKLPSVRNYNKCEEKFLSETAFSHRRHFNENQKRAIHAIVSGLHGPCPYILFGPPGTGKTVTLVEAIRLLLLAEPSQPEKRILVCTPSNTAADNFMLELLDTGAFQVDQLLRIFSFSKKVRVQNEHLLDSGVCCICKAEDGAEKFGIPPIDELLKKRVVVCTLNTSTYLIDGGLENCFTHIIIDEAGQADELETLIPIIGLTDPHSESALRRGRGPTNGGTFKGTHVILAGDPKQLGPVQICDMLKRVAKPGSLIERLIGHEKDRNVFHFDKRVTTMLEENYRSHPALIEIPSRLYYGGKLRSSAPIGEKNTLCQWSNLPKKDFPLLWHSVEEMEESDENGFSFENKAEVDIVYQYVKALIKRAKVEPEQIGIITPYRYQVKQLRLRCAQHYPEILIDSVERFQGTERRVIIISTVRSTGIGFLDSEKRFNTAVTRPKELLIVVGSSYNMRRIKGWEELITYCEQNSALIGQTELSIVQKKKPAVPDAMPPATGANATTKRTSRLRRNGAKESKENDKVEELAREFGGMDMDMDEWLRKKQQPTGAQNTGLFYQADEEDEREIEREMRQWGQPPNFSALDDQWGQQYSYPSSFASDNISPLSNSFHISASQVSSFGGGGLMNESTCSSSIPPPKKSKKKSRKSSTSSSKQSQPQPSLIKIKPPSPKPTTLIQIQPSSKQQPAAIIKLAEKKETNIAVYTLADAIANHKKEEKKRHGKEELDVLGGRKISAATTMAENTSTSPDEEEYETATSGNSPKRPIDGFAIADENKSIVNGNDEDAELSAIQHEMDTLLALKRQMDQLTM